MSADLSWADIVFLVLWLAGIVCSLVIAHDWPRKRG